MSNFFCEFSLEGADMYQRGKDLESRTLLERVQDEADQCRNDGADDIAALLDEVAIALGAKVAI